MAIYTQAEFDSVKAAVLALATGARKVSVTFGGRTVEMQQADLGELRELLAAIGADLATAAGTHQSYRLAATSKGT